MRWFSSRAIWGSDTFLVCKCEACFLLWLVMMRVDFREPVLFRFSRIREGREGEMVLFSGDWG